MKVHRPARRRWPDQPGPFHDLRAHHTTAHKEQTGEPGFIHIDIKYLPQMPDEASRSDVFVAIDRATRWAFLRVYADQGECSGVDFLNRLY